MNEDNCIGYLSCNLRFIENCAFLGELARWARSQMKFLLLLSLEVTATPSKPSTCFWLR